MTEENTIIEISESESRQLPADPQKLRELLLQWAKQLLTREESPHPQPQSEQ